MAIHQIFAKLLDGSNRCLQITSPTITGEALKRDLLAITGIPLESQRIVTGSCIVSDEIVISASPDDGVFPSCTLLLRFPGGKGRFGSLLRGAATKAGQKKTNNLLLKDEGSAQQPSKTYIRYAVRQKRADAKRALKDFLLYGKTSKLHCQLGRKSRASMMTMIMGLMRQFFKLRLVGAEVLPGPSRRGKTISLITQPHDLNGKVNQGGKIIREEYGAKVMLMMNQLT